MSSPTLNALVHTMRHEADGIVSVEFRPATPEVDFPAFEAGSHIDLHGLGQDQARVALERFVLDCWNAGDRAVLVITGKGLRGDGVLRRMTPEWLAAPHLREIIAGVAESHRRHGGEGALYVALKRKRRD